jgi:murein DD-endopeptidase MepM/ murein hydrolase activator NlpD
VRSSVEPLPDHHRAQAPRRKHGTTAQLAALSVSVLVVAAFLAAVLWASTPVARAEILPPTTTTTVPPPPPVLPLFHLPFPAGMRFLVAQGNGGSFSHQAGTSSEFAWDFEMPEGTPVVAAETGRVEYIQQDYQGGGYSDEYLGKANYVVLEHPSGLHTSYLHLAYQGVVVIVGQQVAAGQLIALSGNTGHSSGPHLHFEVEGKNWPNVSSSIPAAFREAGAPVTGALPVSENTFTPLAPAPLAAAPGVVLPGVPSGPTARTAFTHQRLLVELTWVDPPESASPPGNPGAPVPVRLVAADPSGTKRVIATGSAATASTGQEASAPNPLKGHVDVQQAGWLDVWAEYQKGHGWSALVDDSGTLVATSLQVADTGVLLAPTGLFTRPAAGPTSSEPGVAPVLKVKVGDTISVAFGLVNATNSFLRVLKVGPTLLDATGGALPPGNEAFNIEPQARDLILPALDSVAWSGTLTPLRAGTYLLKASAEDASFNPLPLPPSLAETGDTVRLVVEKEGEPVQPPVDPSTPAFADVTPDHPAFSAIQALARKGVVQGFPNPAGKPFFRPDATVTRAQFAKMLVKTLGLAVSEADHCPFADVADSGPSDLYPDNFIAVAAAAGLTQGVSLDPPLFAPDGDVTRRQVLLMLERAVPGLGEQLAGDPWGPATRAEVATLLAPLLKP